jgi:hypothetical protein
MTYVNVELSSLKSWEKSVPSKNLIFKGDTIFGESRKNGLKIIENIIEITKKLLLGLLEGFLLKISFHCFLFI